MSDIVYVVMNLQEWELKPSPKNRIYIPYDLEIDTPMIGYMPVFDTLEAAEKEYPNFPVTPMKRGVDATQH